MAIAAGVRLAAERAGAVPTFNKDVAPIIFNSCVTCHRPDQIAPMSLTSYNEVRPWARAIRDKVIKGEMPPWHADARFGEFRNDRRLSAEQINTIAAWADGGAPEGDTRLAAELPAIKDGWSHPSGRPPDFVIEMANAFTVAAEGEMPNFTIYEELPPKLKEKDHFLEAIQILPEAIAAVHHANFSVAPLPPGLKIGTGEAWPGGPVIAGALVDIKTGKSAFTALREANELAAKGAARLGPPLSGSRFCCYVPGSSFMQFEPGTGKRLPRDGYIAWGMHYTPIGRSVVDRERVDLWFQEDMTHEVVENAGGPTKHIVLGREIIDSEFTPVKNRGAGSTGSPTLPVIPPQARDWAITAIRAFQDDVTIYTLWPHMHTRGKEMTFVLTYPDGREEVLLSVPNYDFNWQIFYQLETPLKVPAGSTIKTIGSYDNSFANKWNPAPQKEVYWSEQNWDEMFVGFVDMSTDKLDLRLKKTPVKSTAAGRQ